MAADNVGHIPTRLDIESAGAIPTTGLTALQGIDEALRLRKGESVIIHGASGGVGTLAVQFAKLRGARVFATASGKGGMALARELGADLAVDGRHDDITSAARRFGVNGIDAALGLAGGDGLSAASTLFDPAVGPRIPTASSPSRLSGQISKSPLTTQSPIPANSSD